MRLAARFDRRDRKGKPRAAILGRGRIRATAQGLIESRERAYLIRIYEALGIAESRIRLRASPLRISWWPRRGLAMLHWTPGRSAISTITPIGALLGEVAPRTACVAAGRSDHARMLAHAAKRRQAASGLDGAYWKACAPAAIAKAAAIRTGAGFSRLP